MDANTYLQKLVTTIPNYKLSDEEQKIIKLEGIEKYIYRKVTSTKFRASALPQVLDEKIKRIISESVRDSKPIHFSVPFGGYKKWQLPTYPLPDWAEVFNLVLMRDYLSPIAAAYKPGVILEYFSDEIFVARMNNYPQEDLDKYNEAFTELVHNFQQYCPANMQLKSSKIRDQISQEELMKRFDKEIAKLRSQWDKLPKEEREYRLKKSERNYKADLSKLPKKEKLAKLLESTLVHDAFIFGDEWEEGVPWAFAPHMIPIGFRYTRTWGIHLRSSRSSTVQFWIGIGVLKKKGDEFVPGILTYGQCLDKPDMFKVSEVSILNELSCLRFVQVCTYS